MLRLHAQVQEMQQIMLKMQESPASLSAAYLASTTLTMKSKVNSNMLVRAVEEDQSKSYEEADGKNYEEADGD